MNKGTYAPVVFYSKDLNLQNYGCYLLAKTFATVHQTVFEYREQDKNVGEIFKFHTDSVIIFSLSSQRSIVKSVIELIELRKFHPGKIIIFNECYKIFPKLEAALNKVINAEFISSETSIREYVTILNSRSGYRGLNNDVLNELVYFLTSKESAFNRHHVGPEPKSQYYRRKKCLVKMGIRKFSDIFSFSDGLARASEMG